MAREILILRRLDHPNIIKLEGLITSRLSCSIYLVFTGLLSKPEINFTESQVFISYLSLTFPYEYWQQ
jgi:serine/threonine protein kinase